MKVKITIECEKGYEVVQHLHALIREAKKELRKAAKNPDKKTKRVELYDNNCYGTHEAVITDFDIDDFIDGVPLRKKQSSRTKK